MLPINGPQIVQFAQDRASLEMELGHRLYSFFDSPPMIDGFRNLVRVAVEQIAALATRVPHAGMDIYDRNRITLERQILDRICADEGALQVWRWDGGHGHNLDGLASVCQNSNNWNAADCSDLVRLYATVIEDPALNDNELGFVSAHVDAHRRSRRRGGANVWGPNARSRAVIARHGGHTGALAGAEGADPLAHIWAARAHTLAAAASWSHGWVPGIDRYMLKAESTVRKIDTVFALPAGADISGTTADSLFVMEHLDQFLEAVRDRHVVGPGMNDLAQAHSFIELHGSLIQLLAPATMVSSGHHTLVESALILTLNGYLNYSIGFYTTLMPHGVLASDTAAQNLWEILVWAEHDPRNRHVLCYQDLQGGLHGYQYGVGPGGAMELDAMRRLCTTSLAFLEYFHSWPAFPQQIHVDTYRTAFGL